METNYPPPKMVLQNWLNFPQFLVADFAGTDALIFRKNVSDPGEGGGLRTQRGNPLMLDRPQFVGTLQTEEVRGTEGTDSLIGKEKGQRSLIRNLKGQVEADQRRMSPQIGCDWNPGIDRGTRKDDQNPPYK